MSNKPTSDNLQLNYPKLVENVKVLVEDYKLLLNRIEVVATSVIMLTTKKLWPLNEMCEVQGLDTCATLPSIRWWKLGEGTFPI